MFNEHSKTSNIVKTSLWNGIAKIIRILVKFLVRTVFIMVLSKEYLGLDGLFANILQVMSVADLGIETAISIRFYEPIKNNDVQHVGRLMNFFRSVYRKIALVITCIGLSFLPLLSFLISDKEAVPADVNIYCIYLLFLASTVGSYLFSYPLTLLSADQKNYTIARLNILYNIIDSFLQMVILFFSHNYTWMLICNTFFIIAWNYGAGIWIKRLYAPVFAVKEMLSKNEQKQIWEGTKATLFHKIGGTVKDSTDSIVLTKIISLSATGIYSNYAQVLASLNGLLCNILGNFVSSIGSARLDKTKEEYYDIYLKLSFINSCIASLTTGCTFLLVNDFILTWIGRSYVLDNLTVGLLCFNLFCTIYRITNISFTNACGWFIKDRYRPLVESVINLCISIVAAQYMGIAGVFLGTAISFLVTVGWREPYILYHYEFQRGVKDYWLRYSKFLSLTGVFCYIVMYLKEVMHIGAVSSWTVWLLEAVVVFLGMGLFLVLCLRKEKEFLFLVDFLKSKRLRMD